MKEVFSLSKYGSKEEQVKEIKKILAEKVLDENSLDSLAKELWTGAVEAGEIEKASFEEWLESRFKYQLVWLDKDDYLRALTRALWLAPKFAGTDFGASRQRDIAQVWTDTTRGFLGEIAVGKFFYENFKVEIILDTKRGKLEEFLPTDISEIILPDRTRRTPNLNVSIKTGKFNARWLDVPGAQVEHSDVFILVKIGILRHHFIAFLKAVSFLKDKLFPQAVSLGELNEEEKKQLWDEIPTFDSIPAYISGFLEKSELNMPIHYLEVKIRGDKHKRIAVTRGIGLFSPENLRHDERIKKLDPKKELRIEIEPIIDALTNTHFLAHSGG